MPKIHTLFSPLVAAIFIGAAPTPAHAVCDGCVVGAVNAANMAIVNAVTSANTSIVGSISRLSEAIVAAIRGSTQTLASQEAKSTEMLIQAQVRIEGQMEAERQDARFAVPDGCAVVAAGRGLQDAARSSVSLGGGLGRGGGGGARAASGGVTTEMQRALDISAGRVAAPSPEQQASLAASGACGTFASGGANPVRANTCQLAGFSAGATNGHPDADIRAETLFDGPQRAAQASGFSKRLTVDADGNERQAVEAYVRNLSVPVDLPQLSKVELNRPGGREYLAYRDAFEARMSMADKPARSLAQNRMNNPALLPVLRQLLQSDVSGAYAANYLDKNYPRWGQRGVSVDEMFNLEAERRYFNKDWHVKMASLPPEAHVKEQTTMLAFQAVLFSRMYEQLSMMNVLQGQAVATQVRQEMMPQLISLQARAGK